MVARLSRHQGALLFVLPMECSRDLTCLSADLWGVALAANRGLGMSTRDMKGLHSCILAYFSKSVLGWVVS
jgi:hypothetical protein